jgi:hypothetical protein
MASKKPTPGRKKDRHRRRQMIGMSPEMHQQLHKLAERNGRPLSWEVRRILMQALAEAGLWPPSESNGE